MGGERKIDREGDKDSRDREETKYDETATARVQIDDACVRHRSVVYPEGDDDTEKEERRKMTKPRVTRTVSRADDDIRPRRRSPSPRLVDTCNTGVHP